MQEQQTLLSRLIKFIKNRYSLPQEAKPHITRRNIKNGFILVDILLVFSALFFVITCFTRKTELIVHVYYSGMFVISLIAFLCLKHFSKKNIYNQTQTLIIVILSLLFILLITNFLNSSYYASGLVAIYIFCLLYVICFDITPLFHISIIIIFAVFFGWYHIQNHLYSSILVNNILFCMVIIILALYKRSSLVKRNVQRLKIKEQGLLLQANSIELEHQKDSLLLNKKVLEDFALSQSEKLKLQNERIIRIQNNTILSLSNLVENRDEAAGNHVLKTRDYVELLTLKTYLTGKYPELNEETLKLIIKAAPLHDIGKIVISDEILKKTGKLSPEEFEEMKLHTTRGGEIAENILGSDEDENYIRIAKEIATTHHEKYDGSGYPYGLKGEEIPLSGRIMAIVDVFDALVSPRCYKSPLQLEDAFMIIKESAGTHFDPALTQIFLDAKKEVIDIYNKYQ